MINTSNVWRTCGIAVVASISLGLISTTNSVAQMPSTTSTDNVAAQGSTEISDIKIGQFADAYLAVQTIQKEALAKQSASADPTAAAAASNDAQLKMAQAIQDSGLQVAEFNQIGQLLSKDTNLRAKVSAKIQERSKP